MAEASDIAKQAGELQSRIEEAMGLLDVPGDRKHLEELESQAGAQDFWNDSAKATAVTKELAHLRRHIESWQDLAREVQDLAELAQLQAAETTPDHTALGELANHLKRLEAEYDNRETELKLAGPYDKSSALLSIYAGTGGTDAQDWAQMLERMYLRYAEKADFSTEILDRSAGEEAGLKSVTMEVNGPFAFGYLRSEKGVHRLVRLSPFNSDNLRQTSFALVDVIPQIDLPESVEIDPKDLRIDVYRSGGHGGQSVNTTDSAVRITHLPTGTVVAIQNERSQLQNKDKAMAVLKSRLAVLMAEQHEEKLSAIRGAVQSADWGSQIRSYVLHPYSKVKDHRTEVETSDTQGVLDGDIDQFIQAYLKSQLGESQK
ncbi:MAG TPA: peptide chain release factor 2 [Candidatus Saccharimonadales bacterium]|nr:peptide chain release factor 2 [Candidatus Saccharimonadales bacterium]